MRVPVIRFRGLRFPVHISLTTPCSWSDQEQSPQFLLTFYLPSEPMNRGWILCNVLHEMCLTMDLDLPLWKPHST